MDLNTDRIVAQEFEWITNNEPTFQIQGNSFIGKVGRAPNGDDIRIKIDMPLEYYPVVKPNVQVVTNIEHPNIDDDGSLALQLLEEWEPRYRIKDIIAATRRLFVRSKNVIRIPQQKRDKVTDPELVQLRAKIQQLQNKITEYSQEITKVKAQKLENAGVSNTLSGAVPISSTDDLKATKLAIEDLLHLIEDKFEDAAMDEIAFFRLYRKYIREYYIITQKLELKGGIKHVVPKQKTETTLGN